MVYLGGEVGGISNIRGYHLGKNACLLKRIKSLG